MRVFVLGAGVIGVTSAWYLAEAGHRVTVIDRQQGAGLETSFANGGQISVSQAEPWANPGAPAKILKWLGREDAPLLFRPRTSLRQWAWGLRFLRECSAARTRENTLQILALALDSRQALQALRRETGIEYDALARGLLQLHYDEAEFQIARARAELIRRGGQELAVKTATECIEIEPALAHSGDRLAGGIYAPSDESGDAHQFTRNLAGLCAQRGVEFAYGRHIEALEVRDSRIAGVRVRADADPWTADAVLVCLGCSTPFLLEPLGLRTHVYPVKGYSVTVPVTRPDEAPTVCLTDVTHKLAFSRLGDRLRVAGTAELDGYDTSINSVRCAAILGRAKVLFPSAGDFHHAQRWAGLRPATPGNVPVIGATRYDNLFLNSGHGTLGWTLACGSARAIAAIMSGRKPNVSFQFAA